MAQPLPAPATFRGWLRWVGAGYDRRALLALALLTLVGGIVGYRWSDLLDANGVVDPLLFFTWALLAALIAWDARPLPDLNLLVAGLAGGAFIEWWGTHSRLWVYFTHERPPLWILPAWPIAALAIDRATRWLDALVSVVEARRGARLSERGFRVVYYVVIPSFVLAMARFSWVTIDVAATRFVIGLMVALALWCSAPRRDLLTFVAGSFIGIFLERWGTSRQCWTYYALETPPIEAIFAHGFAAIAFVRSAALVERLSGSLGRRLRSARDRAPRGPSARSAAHR